MPLFAAPLIARDLDRNVNGFLYCRYSIEQRDRDDLAFRSKAANQMPMTT
jgi:hypothetical protein